MSSSSQRQKKERPSTYIVQDQHNEQELKRLTIQDRMITGAMGGPFPEQADPAIFQRVLDVGCGSGNWAIEAAQAYPGMTLIGIDISPRMVDYAREQAAKYGVADRVEFHVMDVLRMLEFPYGFFDLVNMRFGISYMRTWDWPKLFDEVMRVTRPKGIIRLTDEEVVHPDNSPALMRFFNEMLLCAFFRAGHLFEHKSDGLSAHLAGLLTRYGCLDVQTKFHALEFKTGTEAGQAYYEDVEHFLHTIRPFLKKWGCILNEYDEIARQALTEMQEPSFQVTWNVLTAWGRKP